MVPGKQKELLVFAKKEHTPIPKPPTYIPMQVIKVARIHDGRYPVHPIYHSSQLKEELNE